MLGALSGWVAVPLSINNDLDVRTPLDALRLLLRVAAGKTGLPRLTQIERRRSDTGSPAELSLI